MKLFNQFSVFPHSFQPIHVRPDITSSSVHFSWLPFSIVAFTIWKYEFSSSLLFSLHPISTVLWSIVVSHCSHSMPSVLLPGTFVTVRILVPVKSVSFFLVFHPWTLISFTIRIDVWALSIFFVFLPFPWITVFIVNNQFSKTFLFSIFPVSLVDTLISIVNVISFTMRFSFHPFTLINISIWVVVCSNSILNIIIPITFIAVPIWVLVGPMSFSQVFLPFSKILCFINILELSIAVFLISKPLAIIETAINIGSLSWTFSGAILLFTNIYWSICQIYLWNLGWQRIELWLKNAAFAKVIFSLSPFWIFEIVAFKIITIFIFVLSLPMLEPFLKVTFEKDFIISVQLPLSPKTVVLPLTYILVYLIEPVSPISAPLSFYELSFVNVPVIVVAFSFAMWLRSKPTPLVLFYVVVFDWFKVIDALSTRQTFRKLTLVNRAITKLKEAIALL